MVVCLIMTRKVNIHMQKNEARPPISFHILISTLMDLNVMPQRHFQITQFKSGPKRCIQRKHGQEIDAKPAQYHQLNIKEMQIKTTMRYFHSTVRLAMTKVTSASKDV